MSKLGVAYKRLIDLAELVAIPADGDFYIVSDISNANKEKKVSASRIQHIDAVTGDMTVDGTLAVAGLSTLTGNVAAKGTLTVDGRSTLSGINLVSFESNTIYFEGDAVFN